MRFTGLFSATLLALSLPAGARDLSGKADLPQDIALPQGGELIVQARDRLGAVAGEVRGTPGQPFTLTVPDDGALTITAALVSGLTVALLSKPLAFANDGNATDLGSLPLAPFPDYGLPVTLVCGTQRFALSADDIGARLRSGPLWRTFAPAEAASGAKYGATDGTDGWVWTKGADVSVRLNGVDLAGCRMALPDGAPFVARGNEPGWALSLDQSGALLKRMDGGETRAAPGVVTGTPTGRSVKFGEATALIEDRICRDNATAMPHPFAVSVTIGTETLQGCGGEPRDLLVGPMLTASAIEAVSQMTYPAPNLTFAPDGRVFGTTGCNRFVGSYDLTGEGLHFGPLAGTRMVCPAAQSATEAAMTTILQSITRFDVTDDGQVQFFAGETPVLTTRAGR